ncbi:cytochrome c oxidase assembly protein [Phyllobacterium sp. 21LDTY02-6]|jgi:cytochrome c oxidase assembly protein subunit 11|uniref:cytochrome c oxidase assembly protein n=1 Tax=unclassified Phyllobacterium TaxID=2638441 RepID=UPI00202132A0|nr:MULTISPECIES: cytochrome c oxidase assembly protein [unclassified Phyllobacterium]MCO4318470.1 cytochrome c oxidase assembly protein [Phyllobacterium sp. 21LDTY02-6]MCX8281387.1 cytochrome c oxidase assembly protein [Phyllobacterium sp. 0TCS1.6C]MCX8295957.1 cytochrome c oxidase assembly protein [Phyllobacterium sp. 0TCS1.6A]
MTQSNAPARKSRWSDRTIAISCLAFFFGMVGMAFAAVPLYAMFCQVTGYGGTTQRVEQVSDTILDRKITVRFDANTSGGLPWDFKPVQREVTMNIGETTLIKYEARNVTGKATAGRASFNVTPQAAGAYFNKVECFCFTDTVLKPGEDMEMPVVFFVDPEIVNAPELEGVHTITLSYTFFPIDMPAPVAASADVTKKDKAGQL